MREIRPSGSEGGGAETNRLSLPLSSRTLRVPMRGGAEQGVGGGKALAERKASKRMLAKPLLTETQLAPLSVDR